MHAFYSYPIGLSLCLCMNDVGYSYRYLTVISRTVYRILLVVPEMVPSPLHLANAIPTAQTSERITPPAPYSSLLVLQDMKSILQGFCGGGTFITGVYCSITDAKNFHTSRSCQRMDHTTPSEIRERTTAVPSLR